MPEYRQNPLTREWVILSSERQARPSEFLDQPARRQEASCPFCLGNEHETPEELARYTTGGSEETWSVRVVPNKYPAVNGVDSTSQKDPAACNSSNGRSEDLAATQTS